MAVLKHQVPLPMQPAPREVEFHTYRQPSSARSCLNPAQTLNATPDEVMAIIFQALDPLPARLQIVQVSNSAIHIFDPDTRITNRAHIDRPVGAFIRYGLRMAEVAAAVCEIFKSESYAPSDLQKEEVRDEEDVQVE
jgi:hypothetical protein